MVDIFHILFQLVLFMEKKKSFIVSLFPIIPTDEKTEGHGY